MHSLDSMPPSESKPPEHNVFLMDTPPDETVMKVSAWAYYPDYKVSLDSIILSQQGITK